MRLRKKQSQQSKTSDLTFFPIGSFVKTEDGYFYVMGNTKRYRFITKRVLDSWNPQRIILSSEMYMSRYKVMAKMKFRNGTLIHNISDGRIFLIEKSLKRRITDPDFITEIGGKLSDVVLVSLNEINLHETGEDIN